MITDQRDRLLDALVCVLSAWNELDPPTAMSDHMAPWISMATTVITEVGPHARPPSA